MEAIIPPSDQGSGQGIHNDNTTASINSYALQEHSSQSPPQSLEEEVEDVTMKITPVKATNFRKHSKQMTLAYLGSNNNTASRRKSDEDTCTVAKLPFVKLSTPSSQGLWSSLPDDLICKMTSFLDVHSLLQVRKCNRYLRDLASRNEAGWEKLCSRLWCNKIHSPASPRAPSLPSHYMDIYHTSIEDAHQRQHVIMEEVCYDPDNHTGTIWSFRFKESAGADWTNTDPWYNNLPCRKMVFLKDGSVRQYVPAEKATLRSSSSSVSSDSESSLPELISPNFGSLPHAAPNHHIPHGRLIHPPVSMSWRFLTRPMDLPSRPYGSYVRFSVAGREVPTYSVRRSPTGNWGFVMESCWGFYASFEMPPKQRSPERGRLRRTETGAQWVEVLDSGEETHSQSPTTPPQQPDGAALMDDSALEITNEIQWREAFLYNVGARVLPEGDDATDEFDRAFRGVP